MEISTGLWIALALWIGLFVPYAIWYIRRGRAHGHTWFTWWKPRVTPTLARTFPLGLFPATASSDRLDRARTMRGGPVTDLAGPRY